MPQYKLYYFNSGGFAELSRLLFAHADVAYEDIRFANREEFLEKYKPVFPTGKAPVLEVDGKKYPESNAIARYLAREFNLYGKDNLEAMRIDGIFDMTAGGDIKMVLGPIFYEQDEAKKEGLKKKAAETDIPAILTLLEKIADGECFVGSKITLADIAFFRIMEMVTFVTSFNGMDKFPKLKAINDKVAKEPKIAAWIAKRPETPH